MELTDISYIKSLFERNDFSFSKSLGQNFIVEPWVCPKIAEKGGCDKDICALEIGAGIGVLTKELALRSEKVVSIEIDEGLKPILEETLAEFDNIEIIFGDILKIDLQGLFAEKFAGKKVVVCANLPYYITSPVITRFLEEKLPIGSMTVMVQKEAAQRICAPMGTREAGAITAAVNYYSAPKKLFGVSRGCFKPAPKVDSAVIRLDIRRENAYDVADEKLFFRVVRAAFSQRRKQMINPLSAELEIPKDKLSEILKSVGINPQARAENMTMRDFAAATNSLQCIIDNR